MLVAIGNVYNNRSVSSVPRQRFGSRIIATVPSLVDRLSFVSDANHSVLVLYVSHVRQSARVKNYRLVLSTVALVLEISRPVLFRSISSITVMKYSSAIRERIALPLSYLRKNVIVRVRINLDVCVHIIVILAATLAVG